MAVGDILPRFGSVTAVHSLVEIYLHTRVR